MIRALALAAALLLPSLALAAPPFSQVGTGGASAVADGAITGTKLADGAVDLTGAKVTNVLPAAKGGAGTANGILKANGSGTVSAATAGTDYLAVIPVYKAGLILSTAGSSTSFGITAGAAANDNAAVMMAQSSAYIKTTGTWTVGSGNGCLDTGSIATSTWYHVYAIKRTDLTATDYLCSTSASAPTMPTGYTYKRWIGAMKTNGSSQWTKFYQYDNFFQWDVPVKDIDTTTLGTTPTNFTMTVPTGLNVRVQIKGTGRHATATNVMLIYSPTTTAQAADTPEGNTTSVFNVNNVFVAFADEVVTNTSGQVTAVSSAASTTVMGDTIGWYANFQ